MDVVALYTCTIKTLEYLTIHGDLLVNVWLWQLFDK